MVDIEGFDWKGRKTSEYAEDPSFEQITIKFKEGIAMDEAGKKFEKIGMKDYYFLRGTRSLVAVGYIPIGALSRIQQDIYVIAATRALGVRALAYN